MQAVVFGITTMHNLCNRMQLNLYVLNSMLCRKIGYAFAIGFEYNPVSPRGLHVLSPGYHSRLRRIAKPHISHSTRVFLNAGASFSNSAPTASSLRLQGAGKDIYAVSSTLLMIEHI